MSLERMCEISQQALTSCEGEQDDKVWIGELLCALWDPWLDDAVEQELAAIIDEEPYRTRFVCDVGGMAIVLDNSLGTNEDQWTPNIRYKYDDDRVDPTKLRPKVKAWTKTLEKAEDVVDENSLDRVMNIMVGRDRIGLLKRYEFDQAMETYREALIVFKVIDKCVSTFGKGVLGHLCLRLEEVEQLDVKMLELVLQALSEDKGCRDKFKKYERDIRRVARLWRNSQKLELY